MVSTSKTPALAKIPRPTTSYFQTQSPGHLRLPSIALLGKRRAYQRRFPAFCEISLLLGVISRSDDRFSHQVAKRVTWSVLGFGNTDREDAIPLSRNLGAQRPAVGRILISTHYPSGKVISRIQVRQRKRFETRLLSYLYG